MGEVYKHPELIPYLVPCYHCGILFLTDPRNSGRDDLGCPFGCADAHRKVQSNQRTAAYYNTDRGRDEKKKLNAQAYDRRRKTQDRSAALLREYIEPQEANIVFRPSLLEYLSELIYQLEGEIYTTDVLREFLEKKFRQLSMGMYSYSAYLLDQINISDQKYDSG